MKKYLTISLIASGLALALLTTGYYKKLIERFSEHLYTNRTGENVNFDFTNPGMETTDFVSSSTTVPSIWSTDVPLPDKMDIQSITVYKTQPTASAFYVTADTAAQVSDYYNTQLPAQGWEKTSYSGIQMDDNVVQFYGFKDDRSIRVETKERADGKITVSVYIYQKS